MNWFALIAGLFGLFTTVGHFVIGGRTYLKPVVDSSIEAVPKRVIQSVFHYVSAFLVLSTAALLLTGFGVELYDGSVLLLKFIAVNYIVFAVWEISLALSSNIEKSLTKMFHWVFFAVILGCWTVVAFMLGKRYAWAVEHDEVIGAKPVK